MGSQPAANSAPNIQAANSAPNIQIEDSKNLTQPKAKDPILEDFKKLWGYLQTQITDLWSWSAQTYEEISKLVEDYFRKQNIQKLSNPKFGGQTDIDENLKNLLSLLKKNKEEIAQIAKDWAENKKPPANTKDTEKTKSEIIGLYSPGFSETYFGVETLGHSDFAGFKSQIMMPAPARLQSNSANVMDSLTILIQGNDSTEIPILLPPASVPDWKFLGNSQNPRIHFNWAQQKWVGFQKSMKKNDRYLEYKVYLNSEWPKNSTEVQEYEIHLSNHREFYMGTPGLLWEDIPSGIQKALLKIKNDPKLSTLEKLEALSIFTQNLGSLGLDVDFRDVYIKEIEGEIGLNWQTALFQNLGSGEKGLSEPLMMNSRGYAEVFANFVRILFQDQETILTTRIVLGYRGNGGIIESQNSWAWSEVYVREMGYVFFNPSPNSVGISASSLSQIELLLKLAPLAKFIPKGLLKSLIPDSFGNGEQFASLAKSLAPSLFDLFRNNPELGKIAEDLASEFGQVGGATTGAGFSFGDAFSGFNIFSGVKTHKSKTDDYQTLSMRRSNFLNKFDLEKTNWKLFVFNPILRNEFLEIAQEIHNDHSPSHINPSESMRFFIDLINKLKFRRASLAESFEDLKIARSFSFQYLHHFQKPKSSHRWNSALAENLHYEFFKQTLNLPNDSMELRQAPSAIPLNKERLILFFKEFLKNAHEPLTQKEFSFFTYLDWKEKWSQGPLKKFPDLMVAYLQTPNSETPTLGILDLFISKNLGPEHSLILDAFEKELYRELETPYFTSDSQKAILNYLKYISETSERYETFFKNVPNFRNLVSLPWDKVYAFIYFKADFKLAMARQLVSIPSKASVLDEKSLYLLSTLCQSSEFLKSLNPTSLLFENSFRKFFKDELDKDSPERAAIFTSIFGFAARVYEDQPSKFFELIEISKPRKLTLQSQFNTAALKEVVYPFKVWMIFNSLASSSSPGPGVFSSLANFPLKLKQPLLTFLTQKTREEGIQPIGTNSFAGITPHPLMWKLIFYMDSQGFSGEEFFYFSSRVLNDFHLNALGLDFPFFILDPEKGNPMSPAQTDFFEKRAFPKLDASKLVLSMNLKISYLLAQKKLSVEKWEHTLFSNASFDASKLFEKTEIIQSLDFAIPQLLDRPEIDEVSNLLIKTFTKHPGFVENINSALHLGPRKSRKDFLKSLIDFCELKSFAIHESPRCAAIKNLDLLVARLVIDLSLEDFAEISSSELLQKFSLFLDKQVKQFKTLKEKDDSYRLNLIVSFSNRLFFENLLSNQVVDYSFRGFFSASYTWKWTDFTAHKNYSSLLNSKPETLLIHTQNTVDGVSRPLDFMSFSKAYPYTRIPNKEWETCYEDYLAKLPDDFFLDHYVLNQNSNLETLVTFLYSCSTHPNFARFINPFFRQNLMLLELNVGRIFKALSYLGQNLRSPLVFDQVEADGYLHLLKVITINKYREEEHYSLFNIVNFVDFEKLSNPEAFQREYIDSLNQFFKTNLGNVGDLKFFLKNYSRGLYLAEKNNQPLGSNNFFNEVNQLLFFSKLSPTGISENVSSTLSGNYFRLTKALNALESPLFKNEIKEQLKSGLRFYLNNIDQHGNFPNKELLEKDFRSLLKIQESLKFDEQRLFDFVISRYGAPNLKLWIEDQKDSKENSREAFEILAKLSLLNIDFSNFESGKKIIENLKNDFQFEDYQEILNLFSTLVTSSQWASLNENQQTRIRKLGLDLLGSLPKVPFDSLNRDDQINYLTAQREFEFLLAEGKKIKDADSTYLAQVIFEKSRDFEIYNETQPKHLEPEQLFGFVLAIEPYVDLLESKNPNSISMNLDFTDKESLETWISWVKLFKKINQNHEDLYNEMRQKIGFEKLEEFRKQYPSDRLLKYQLFVELSTR